MKLTTIYWRDIPAQVLMKQGRTRAKALLSDRFQEAIDHAAMRAKATDENAYLDDWHRVESDVQGDDPDDIVKQCAQSIEDSFDDERLAQIIKNQGREA